MGATMIFQHMMQLILLSLCDVLKFDRICQLSGSRSGYTVWTHKLSGSPMAWEWGCTYKEPKRIVCFFSL